MAPMNNDLRNAFGRIKPVCDVLMVRPTTESIAAFNARVSELRDEVVQELQQYLLFPLITHLKSSETENNHELQQKLVDSMRTVLEKVTVNSFEMCMKMEIGLLQIVFDHTKTGMIAPIPEELKYSVMCCLTVLLLRVDAKYREVMLKTHVPLLGKAVYVSVHIAKLEKYRALRLAAINSVTAHTATHADLTTDYHITDATIERHVVDMLSLILPGVLGALQDVATDNDNPGHALIVAAIDAMHRILCLTMHNKFMQKTKEFTPEDFAKLIIEKESNEAKNKDPKSYPVRSPKWFNIAGEKLLLITRSISVLKTHEHFKVRKELAIYNARLLFECDIAMRTSVPLALEVLVTLSKDEYPEVSEYCMNAINTYLSNITDDLKVETMDILIKNFFSTLSLLPRVMNNVGSDEKLSILNMLHGYIVLLEAGKRPSHLTSSLSVWESCQAAVTCLLHCVAMQADLTMLTHHTATDVTSPPPLNSPWCKFRHLDSVPCERRVCEILRALGGAECSSFVVDTVIDLFHHQREPELVYMCNWMASAPNSSEDLVRRILDTYIEEDVWYLPLEVGSNEPPLTKDDTLDVSVYNPRAWYKDSVPDLYEGAIETRYTDISYRTPRVTSQTAEPNTCATLGEAQRNMLLSCLLTEGVGVMAKRLGENYQPYLLKTLCLLLERVGSKYELLHLAGLKAIHEVSLACGHESVGDLIKYNADYFTNQVTARLKKAWNCQSALQILSVVMEYSDKSILNYLYGIVQDVLVQSCDKYYEKDLYAYLQVFLTFVECIRKWFPDKEETKPATIQLTSMNCFHQLDDYLQNNEKVEKLLNDSEFEKESGKSVEEMYKEDLKKKEEDVLDYDDSVTKEKSPPPQHVKVTLTILKRCLNYVTSSNRDNSILALQVLNKGLPVLRGHDDLLLPLMHLVWGSLATRFKSEPAVMKRAFELLVTTAELTKDFIRSRCVKDVLPHIYNYLQKCAKDSYLKDVGSSYRTSQAYSLQVTALAALPHLATHLELQDEALEDAMKCVDPYLSKKQPKPLQLAAVEFYKILLEYDLGAAWYHLRELCDNDIVLNPPANCVLLHPIVGTPWQPKDKDLENNIKIIFNDTGMS